MIHLLPSREVAISIGTVAIHWYGILYVVAFLVGAWLLPSLQRERDLALNADQRNSLIVHCIVGVLVGGRLGYVLLYGFSYYSAHPAEIVAVWQGGMSSHGGIVGVLIALALYCRREHVNIFRLADVLMVPVAIGLALGRLGNFINGELYGTITSVPWAMHFPGAAGARHPTQLYAIAKDLTIALVCYLQLTLTSTFGRAPQSNAADRPDGSGITTALFLMLYGAFRFLVEIFRDQPFGYVHIGSAALSWGQLFTVPVFLAGAILWLWRANRSAHS